MKVSNFLEKLETALKSQDRSILTLLAALVFAGILFARDPVALLNADFWGEDGWFWYPDAYAKDFGSLLIPHTGYLQSFPRLIAIFSQLFPLAWAPTIFVCAALFIRLVPPALLLSRRFDDEIPSLSARLFLSVIYICLPNSFETYLNITNSQWHLGLVAFLLITGLPAETRVGRLAAVSLLALCCVSGPFCFMILPVAAWRWLALRSRHAAIVLACVTILAALQGAVFLATGHSSRPKIALGVSAYNFVRIIAVQIPLGLMIGARVTTKLMFSLNLANRYCMTLLTSVFFLVCAVAFWRGISIFKQFALYGALILVAALLTPVISETQPPWMLMGYPGVGQRYFLTPMLVLVAAILTLTNARVTSLRVFGSMACALLLVGVVNDWSYPQMRATNFNREARRFDRAPVGSTFVLQINPTGAAPMIFTKTRR